VVAYRARARGPGLTMAGWDLGTIVGGAFGLSIATFLVSLVVMPLIVARIRPDYFVVREPTEASWAGRHPVLRITILLIKNGIGLLLVLAGLAMLVLPGQGIVTVLVGLSLVNFPGKRRLELYIVRKRYVLKPIQWIRERAKQPPLIVPDREREDRDEYEASAR
jgi:hypothetical protein